MSRYVIAALSAALGLSMAFAPAHAGDITVAEAGARFGQATAAAKFCPGGKITAKADSLAGAYTGEDATVFKAQADNVTAAWDKAFTCVEVDPTTRRTTQCRKMILTSCRQAWIEIGPEGRNVPGLLDVDFNAWAEQHPEVP